ncbi:hypothetical protein [Staphylococcus phage vB_SauM-V1SA09]|nr:hypothetical protein [Staphylococcus phage vB_ScaM-V1SC01]WOZ17343.1 hypothetical protein [Staphylococcus phage vB_SauM-V1SA09]
MFLIHLLIVVILHTVIRLHCPTLEYSLFSFKSNPFL